MIREQLQNELGFSKSYTNKQIASGMPPDSIEEAKKWLEENTKKGTPGNRSKGSRKVATAVLPEAKYVGRRGKTLKGEREGGRRID